MKIQVFYLQGLDLNWSERGTIFHANKPVIIAMIAFDMTYDPWRSSSVGGR